MGSRIRIPAPPSDNAAIARKLRTDSEALRVSEQWVRKRIYGLEDEQVRALFELYLNSYRVMLDQLTDAYDADGSFKSTRLTQLTAQMEREIDALMDAAGITLDQSLIDAYQQGYYGRAWALDMATLPSVTVKMNMLLPAEAIRAQLTQDYVGVDNWIDINRTELISRIKRSLTTAMISGDGMRKAQRRLRDELGIQTDRRRGFKANFYKTMLITRTEIMRASNLGALAVYEQNRDILKGWEWVATRDERTCPICGGMDGKVFTFDSSQLQPPSGSHPGCRCTIIPVLIDEELMDRVAGVRETYCDWALRTGVVDDAELCRQRASDAHGLNQGQKQTVTISDKAQNENNASLWTAKGITPEVLERGAASGELFDYMMNFFAYDNRGRAIFSSETISDERLNLLYDVYTFGRGDIKQVHINTVRMKAAALLSADSQLGNSVLSRKEFNMLMDLASPTDSDVLDRIDKFRDRRMKGSLGSGGAGSRGQTYRYDAFVSAQFEDGAERLRDYQVRW